MAEPSPGDRECDQLLVRAAERMAAAGSILLTCHRRPDGDSVGSLVALASILEQQGKQVTLYNPDLVPRRLKWMARARGFTRKLAPGARYAVTVVVDCADAALLGSSFPPPEVTGALVVLDHHGSGQRFGDIYVCDPGAASVGVLVARIARMRGWPIPADAAEGIYVSLVSDTGSFRYSNTNAEALHLAAELVDGGVDPWAVAERLFERATMQRYRLLSAALGTLEQRLDGRVVFMTVTAEMIKACGATWDDSVDLVSYTRALDGVECGVLFTPAKQGGTRVSMRSKGRYVDAGALCATLGGGGHPGAAGCVLPGGLDESRARIEQVLAGALDSAGAGPELRSDAGPGAAPDAASERGESGAEQGTIRAFDNAPGQEG